jgi:uncharacterized protein (TIGR02246 family)
MHEFERAVDDHLEAIRARNLPAFAASLARDVTLVGTSGEITRGYDAAVEAHRAWFGDAGWTLTPHVVQIAVRPETAWALVRVGYAAAGTTTEFMLLLLFAREDGEWKLTYDQGTAIAG